jgi:3-oxoacyl-[acyl-carrier protein] reductase
VSLQGKIAIVTGAGRGIGRAIAQELAAQGADVVLNSFTEANAQRAAEEISEATGRAVTAVAGDVGQVEVVDRIVAAAMDKFGRVDILVNNAGLTRDGLLVRMSDDDWDAVMDGNLKGAFLFSRSVARPMMKQRAGRIINITSVMGLVGNAGQANYAASKAGLIGLTKSIAKELGSRNVTVNAVAPGFIETDMTATLGDAIREGAIKQTPLGRLGSTADIAKLVAFLASDDAGYITGQVISVDGGMFM